MVRSLTFTMLWLAAMTVVLDVWLYMGEAVREEHLASWFNSASEDGLGSWLSVTQTLLIAVTLWVLAAAHRSAQAPRGRVWGWAALAAFFSYLALDDGTHLHERVGSAFRDSDVSLAVAWFPSYDWQLVMLPVFVALGAAMVVFLLREIRAPRPRGLVLIAVALMGAAVGLDFVDGLEAGHSLNVYAWIADRWLPDATSRTLFEMGGFDAVAHLSRAIEESLEMASMTLLWATFLSHGAATFRSVTVRVEDGAVADAVLEDARVPALA